MKKQQLDDFSKLEAELRAFQQGRQTSKSVSRRAQEEELLRYLASVQTKEKPKKKKQLSESARIHLARQQQDREMRYRERERQARQIQVAENEPEKESAAEESTAQAKLLQVPENSPDWSTQNRKSWRERMLEDPNMRYVLVKDSILAHDKLCPEAAALPDDQITVTESFPQDRWFCDRCYFRALIRSGLERGQEEHLETYYEAFRALQAEGGPLGKLIRGCKAQLYDAEADRVFLKMGEERWLIAAEQLQCQLYEIVSREDPQTGRTYSRLRPDLLGDFEKVVLRIEEYPKEKQRQQYLRILKRVLGTRNVRRLRCISVLYRYYIYADCLRQHRALGWKWGFPMKILDIREYPDCGFTTVVCRIRRRDEGLFWKATKDMKHKSMAIDGNAYADFCNAHLPADDEQRLMTMLQGRWRRIKE